MATSVLARCETRRLSDLKLESIPIMTQSLCSICLIADSRTLVLQLASGTYGSLDLDRLEQLASDLRELSLISSADDVIVDLSAVKTGGSGFLTCLSRFCEDLALAGKRLVICGDQVGLIAQVGWSQRMNLQADLRHALDHNLRTAA